ncbi:Protein-tyrosine/Dual-specificity phosphatase [Penicillium alfredii]|uniref:Protein-tyrosine/Dual-specificity phosphatase n=1 Tax=Penicillium alfredii TaxID=1506179 RepID=A0A9W9K3B1_9EURO|nr:Protein-tyrosine/Dual-specificity phosphatase [Penicillium alfredii]KAJ5091544.1 Protein-tyrosine/Dual-specificity phosphatase [Penicillium alfredii]
MSFLSPTAEVPMSQDEQAPYVRTQEYMPAPRYPLQPYPGFPPEYFNLDDEANANDTVIVDNKIFSAASHDFAEGDFICPGFFDRAHAQLGGFTRRFNCLQWSYEMRREAQPVLPFLSLGPSSCLRDRAYLRRQGFTLLLAIRSRQYAQASLVSGDKAAADIGALADAVDVVDNQELISAFPRAVRRINDHLAGTDMDMNMDSQASFAGVNNNTNNHISSAPKKKVLVFCESGNERSAGVVIAYLMVMLNLDSAHATAMVQQRRFCVSIEDPMKQILVSFELILAAKRDVERAKRVAAVTPAPSPATLAPPSSLPVPLTRKRSFSERRKSDFGIAEGEMDVDSDEDGLAERKPVAPFQDRVV